MKALSESNTIFCWKLLNYAILFHQMAVTSYKTVYIMRLQTYNILFWKFEINITFFLINVVGPLISLFYPKKLRYSIITVIDKFHQKLIEIVDFSRYHVQYSHQKCLHSMFQSCFSMFLPMILLTLCFKLILGQLYLKNLKRKEALLKSDRI